MTVLEMAQPKVERAITGVNYGRFVIEPLDAVSLGEPQNAEASAEPLFGMRLRPHDRAHR